ncbi:MAG: sulfurtransferase TusA family protein [Euryarchaeota archaeon]|nr:sulfurtransferase TusA family protein [Euryarchaeota archaeon]
MAALPRPDSHLDLRGVECPYNFVKTKLRLEEMEPGQVLEIILDPGEPMENVPRSIRDDGHHLLLQEPYDGGRFRLIVRKSASPP